MKAHRQPLPDWYVEWAKRHAIAFGFTEQNMAMLAEWGMVWRHLYSPDELHAATDALLSKPVHVEPWNHRRSIQAHIEDARHRKATTRGEQLGVCTLCDSTGLVIVPHPRCFTQDGAIVAARMSSGPQPRPIYMTTAVLCRCGLGRFKQTHNERAANDGKVPGKLMTIETYENRYPSWADAMAFIDGRRILEVATQEDAIRQLRQFSDRTRM